MRFIHSAALTIVFKAVAMISGLAVSIVIARVLGPEGRGVYALIMTIIVMSASFGVFGLTASNTYLIAKDQNKSRAVGTQSLLAGFIGTILCGIVILGIDRFGSTVFQGLNSKLLWLTLALVPLFLWGNLFSFAYLGRGRILAFNLFETSQRVIFLALSLLFIWYFKAEFETYLGWVLGLVAVLIAIYVFGYFATSPDGRAYDSSLNSPALAYGIKSYIATILTLIVMRSGIMFVNYFLGTTDAGLFAVAQQISELVIIVPTIVGTVLFGRVSRGDSFYLTPMVVRTMSLIFLPVTLVLFFASGWLVEFIFGSAFGGSTILLQIMLPGAFLLGLEVVLAQDLAGRGYPWPAVLMWLPTVIVNIVGYVILIPILGVAGAAISVAVSFVLIFALILGYYISSTDTKLSELFLVRSDDLKTLLSIIFGNRFKETNIVSEGLTDADATVSDKSKVETQNAVG